MVIQKGLRRNDAALLFGRDARLDLLFVVNRKLNAGILNYMHPALVRHQSLAAASASSSSSLRRQ